MDLRSFPAIRSFFVQLLGGTNTHRHSVYLWVRAKVGAKYTFSEFRQRVLYVGKCAYLKDRLNRYEKANRTVSGHAKNSNTVRVAICLL